MLKNAPILPSDVRTLTKEVLFISHIMQNLLPSPDAQNARQALEVGRVKASAHWQQHGAAFSTCDTLFV